MNLAYPALRTHQRSRCLAWVWLVCLTGFWGLQIWPVGTAHADDIPAVTLSDAGPNRPLPLGQSFYLTGTAPAGANAIHPIFVRYSYAPWGIRKGLGISSCSQVRAALSSLIADAKAAKAILARTGTIGISELWQEPSTAEPASSFRWLNEHHEAYQPGVWVRPEGDAGKDPINYKVLVPGNRFFRPDASYCLMLYQEGTSLQAVKAVTGATEQFVAHMRQCAAQLKSSGSSTACVDAAYREYETAIDQTVRTSGKENDGKIIQKINRLLAQAETAPTTDEISRILHITQSWSEYARPARTGEYLSLVPANHSDPLAALLIGLLANQAKHVLPVIQVEKKQNGQNEQTTSEIAFYSADGKLRITQIWLASDLSSMMLSGSQSPADVKDRRLIQVDLSKMLIPDHAISVRELLEFANGRILLGDSYVDFAELGVAFLDEMLRLSKLGEIMDQDQLAPILQVHDRLIQLNNFVLMALRAYQDSLGKDLNIDAQPATLLLHAGRWLHTQLKPCNPSASPALFVCRPPTDQPAKPLSQVWYWPGYANVSGNPISEIESKLRTYIKATESWHSVVLELEKVLASVVIDSVNRQPEIVIQGGPKAWLFNYITLTTGFSCILAATQPFWLHQVGLQIYFWPNLFEEPMWYNGIYDFRRLFFIEAAIATTPGQSGPEGRFSGPPGISFDTPILPFFLGAGLQLLPYTSVSAGVAFLGRRSSTLAQEQTVFRASPYIGLSLQFNIPDAIKFLSKSKSYEQTGKQ